MATVLVVAALLACHAITANSRELDATTTYTVTALRYLNVSEARMGNVVDTNLTEAIVTDFASLDSVRVYPQVEVFIPQRSDNDTTTQDPTEGNSGWQYVCAGYRRAAANGGQQVDVWLIDDATAEFACRKLGFLGGNVFRNGPFVDGRLDTAMYLSCMDALLADISTSTNTSSLLDCKAVAGNYYREDCEYRAGFTCFRTAPPFPPPNPPRPPRQLVQPPPPSPGSAEALGGWLGGLLGDFGFGAARGGLLVAGGVAWSACVAAVLATAALAAMR